MKRKIFSILLILIFLIFISCHDHTEFIQPESGNLPVLTIDQAIHWYEKNNNHQWNLRETNDLIDLEPIWNLALEKSNGNRNFISVPLSYYQTNNRIGKGFMYKRIFELDENENIQSFIIEVIGSADFLMSNNYQFGGENFSGIIKKYDHSGKLIFGEYLLKGEFIGTVGTYEEANSKSHVGRTSGGHWVEVIIDNYQQACVGNVCGLWTYLDTTYEYVFVQDNQDPDDIYGTFINESNLGGGTSGPGGGGTGTCGNDPGCFDNPTGIDETIYDIQLIKPVELIVDLLPDKPITDIVDYLKCFNSNQGATLVLYVDQPVENSSQIYRWLINGNIDNGHTFISISQNGIRRVLGFYPEDLLDIVISSTSDAVLGDDGGHSYDVAVTTELSPIEFANLLNFLQSPPSVFDIYDYNCSDYGLDCMEIGDINLPDSPGSYGDGSGTNPAYLAQDIRSLFSNSSYSVVKSGGNALYNSGDCN